MTNIQAKTEKKTIGINQIKVLTSDRNILTRTAEVNTAMIGIEIAVKEEVSTAAGLHRKDSITSLNIMTDITRTTTEGQNIAVTVDHLHPLEIASTIRPRGTRITQ